MAQINKNDVIDVADTIARNIVAAIIEINTGKQRSTASPIIYPNIQSIVEDNLQDWIQEIEDEEAVEKHRNREIYYDEEPGDIAYGC